MFENSYISDEEDDDDWFFNSIQRYDDLLMYEFQGKVSSVAFHSAERLIATCLNTNGRHEILELAVPDRLLAGKDAGIVKNRDFSVEAAGYLKSEASCVIPYENVLITSEAEGVHLYKIPNHDNTDLISHKQLIRKSANPQIYFNPTRELLSGSTISNIKTHSIETGKELKDLSSILSKESLTKNYNLSFLESRSTDLIFGCGDIGLLYYIDSRSDILRKIDITESKCGWAYTLSSEGKIGLVNSLGILYIFDNRNLSKEVLKMESQFDTFEEETSLNINFDRFNSRVSVSGFDKSVKVFCLNSLTDIALKFTHDGHKKNCSYVNGHIWHPTLINVIFSYDDSGALQAWKFK